MFWLAIVHNCMLYTKKYNDVPFILQCTMTACTPLCSVLIFTSCRRNEEQKEKKEEEEEETEGEGEGGEGGGVGGGERGGTGEG